MEKEQKVQIWPTSRVQWGSELDESGIQMFKSCQSQNGPTFKLHFNTGQNLV